MIGKSAHHCARVLLGLEPPASQVTTRERECLGKWSITAKTIVEIGVFEGATTHYLAQRVSPDTVIYGVDPFFPGRLGICWGEVISRHCLRNFLRSGQVTLIKALSTETETRIPPVVDMIFIDGDHSLEGIAKDWMHWRKRASKTGIIALHDSVKTPGRPERYSLGSIEYFTTTIRNDAEFEIAEQVESLTILRKV